MLKPLYSKILYLLIILTLPGCATMQFRDLFSGYAQQMEPVKFQANNGQFKQAIASTPERSVSDTNYVLALLEKGRLSHLSGDYPTSIKLFSQASHYIDEQKLKAKLQVSKGFQNVGAIVSNDSAITYVVPDYEQSMMHSYQALNYLYQKNTEAALVEIRKANLVQRAALENNFDAINDAIDSLENEVEVDWQSISDTYPEMENIVGKAKNGFQNAYTFYISGVLYEASGELNDAYIDYKKALEIYPENTYLQQDVLKIAKKLGMTDDLQKFEKRFGKYTSKNVKNDGQIVVVYEQDLVEARDEMVLRLPVYTSKDDMRFYSLALPVYNNKQQVSHVANFQLDSKALKFSQIVKVEALAAQTLKSQLPGLITRQVLRLIAKEKVRKKMSKEAGDVGNILANLYNLASERADTRSWLTLPQSTNILRTYVKEGEHHLVLNIGGKHKKIEVDVKPNRITLVNITAMSNHIGYKTINL
ncbi:COG3014 family protein [Pseudoalteromonas denitrificans]|uniref:Uncharacterized protein n=1 Tax=Pseudoalteromonas denitrificans DSM 6059 TaxID=1123010 RepID=A0A1I1KJ87_9GAMM|nr:hypothetical protein [Pseudoalteromonas denitrificans]SFC60332.1 hypothetical protein SAMN02745724_02063 [Pseudoalteromonas denitrificans DSM 6059]